MTHQRPPNTCFKLQWEQKSPKAVESASLLAPELLNVQVISVLRRAVLRRGLTEERAALAAEDLTDWSIDLLPHRSLVWAAWRHRHDVTAYDTFYVAAAQISGASLLTADGLLSRAPSLGIVVENIRLA